MKRNKKVDDCDLNLNAIWFCTNKSKKKRSTNENNIPFSVEWITMVVYSVLRFNFRWFQFHFNSGCWFGAVEPREFIRVGCAFFMWWSFLFSLFFFQLLFNSFVVFFVDGFECWCVCVFYLSFEIVMEFYVLGINRYGLPM